MLRPALAAFLLLATGHSAGRAADDSPDSALSQCLARLDEAVARVGTPGSAESSVELEALASAVAQLKADARRLAGEKEPSDQARATLDRRIRDQDDRIRQLEFEQKAHDHGYDELGRRFGLQRADALRQHAAANAAQTAEAAASANAWGATVNARKAMLEREQAEWNARNRDLQARREGLLADEAMLAQALSRVQQRASALERQVVLAGQRCEALARRTLAFSRIAGIRRASSVHYPKPDEQAEELVRGLLLGAGNDAVGRLATSTRMHALAVTSRSGLRTIGRVASKASVAFAAADLFMDAAIAGMKPREREVVRNIYLIGDYAHALKVIAREQGAAGFHTPEYEAIREELERLRAEMPQGDFDFMMEGLGSFAAVTEGFYGLATKYTGGKAGSAAASVLTRLTKMDRQVHGRTGMSIYRGLLSGGGELFAGAMTGMARQGAERAVADPESSAGPSASRDSTANTVDISTETSNATTNSY